MNRSMRAALIACAALLFSLAPAFAQENTRQASVFPYALLISDREDRVIAEIPLPKGRFDHVFVHSFHLTPVVERFEVVPGRDGKPLLHLFELVYQSSGVGMPEGAENGYRLVGGTFILDMSRDFASIPVMVSIVAGHGVTVEGRFYPFTAWVPPETQLVVSAKAAF